tara:strand:- start:189 stop:698 length:510 start_codon:yes stop_codon:yes gene_type:complete
MPKKKKTGLHPGGSLPTTSVSPIMDQFNKKSLDEFNKKIRTPGKQVKRPPPRRNVDPKRRTTYRPPQPRSPQPIGGITTATFRDPQSLGVGFSDAQRKAMEKRFKELRRGGGSVGRTARASGPGRRNRRAMPFRQPIFQPFRNYTYSGGGLTKSTTELSTGLKKAKDSK